MGGGNGPQPTEDNYNEHDTIFGDNRCTTGVPVTKFSKVLYKVLQKHVTRTGSFLLNNQTF